MSEAGPEERKDSDPPGVAAVGCCGRTISIERVSTLSWF